MAVIGLVLIGIGVGLLWKGPLGSYWNGYKADADGRRARVRGTRRGHRLFCSSLVWTGLVLLGAGLAVLPRSWVVWAILPAGLLFMSAAWADRRAA